jgi:hypothetical protein
VRAEPAAPVLPGDHDYEGPTITFADYTRYGTGGAILSERSAPNLVSQ